MTIKAKITAISTLVFGLLLSLFALLIYNSMREAEVAKLDARLEVYAGKVQAEFEEEQKEDPTRVLQILHLERTEGAPGMRMRLFDRQGFAIYADSELAGTPAHVSGSALKGSEEKEFSRLAGNDVRVLWTPIEIEDSVRYVLQLTSPMTDVESNLRYLRLLFSITIPLSLILIAVASFIITRFSFRPMRGMVETAKRISANTLDERLTLPAAMDEVRLLGETLNDMMERIDSAFKSQRQFIADASHEIRTPLTIISNELEYAERNTRDKKLRESVQISLIEIDRLTKMAEGMLLLARLDGSNEVLHKKPTRLDELLIECVQSMRGVAAKKQIDVALTIEDAIEVPVDGERLKGVFLNLLDNAIKYSTSASRVAVTLHIPQAAEKIVRVTVEDHGSGISPSVLPHIFGRFYRAEDARADAAGSGLGLAIAERVVSLHGGRITVRSEEGKGSIFTVELPIF